MSSKRKLEELPTTNFLRDVELRKKQLTARKAKDERPSYRKQNGGWDKIEHYDDSIMDAPCLMKQGGARKNEVDARHPNNSSPKSSCINPPILSNSNDSVIVSKSKEMSSVTAIAIATTTNDEYPALYSGHADGKICKWDLETNAKIWEKQVFCATFMLPEGANIPNSQPRNSGIRGIAIKENSPGNHLVYAWSNAFENNDTSIPNKIKVLNGQNGELSQELICEIDDDIEIQPLITCIVFSKLNYNDVWEEATIVGLEATAEVLDHNDKYTDFDLDEAEDYAHGNILPLIGEDIEETWRGHSGIIRSMAVVPDKYIVSCSEYKASGAAEMIILWAAKEPGVPIHRINSEPSRPLINCLQGGISISENNMLLGCEGGDMLVPIDIVDCSDDDGNKTTTPRTLLQMRGIAKMGKFSNHIASSSSKGCLVGCGDRAILNHKGCNEVLVFQISTLCEDPKLETTDAPPFKGVVVANGANDTTSNGTTKSSSEKEQGNGSSNGFQDPKNMAPLGKIIFPESGPRSLAMKGQWVVAGFENGSILRAGLLPDHFKNNDMTKGSNLHASYCPPRNDNVHPHGENHSQTPHFDALDQPTDSSNHFQQAFPHQSPQQLPPQCAIQ